MNLLIYALIVLLVVMTLRWVAGQEAQSAMTDKERDTILLRLSKFLDREEDREFRERHKP